jgi:hypothetical protein
VSHPPKRAISFLYPEEMDAFLHLKGEIQICHRADEQNVLKIVPFPQ